MSSIYADQFQDGVLTQSEQALEVLRNGVGILVEDSLNRRLIESSTAQLDLECIELKESSLDLDKLLHLEMIIADKAWADRVHRALEHPDGKAEGIKPAVISVVQNEDGIDNPALTPVQHPYDGVLPLPQPLTQLTAQLSLMLYSHRAFARRYQSAMEELYLNRRIFRSVTSGISVSNAQLPDMPLTYVNPAFEVMTGYTLEEVHGQNCRFLQRGETDQPGLVAIRNAIRDRREVTAVIRNFRKDGTPFWNELSLSPIRNRDGEVTHFVGIQTDVTARVEFEAALRESEKLAAVGRLASTIAHEINNPLASVMNLVYLAQDADSLEDAKKYLATADAELQRVKLITTQSLRFFKQSTKPMAVSASELLNSVLDVYQSRLQNAAIAVHRRERTDRPVKCMESEIRQVLNNLVGNAIDAMNRIGGRLLVRTRAGKDWRTGVSGIVITVADTGTGIDPTMLTDIYKAFYTTKGIGGTGLGLWISSGIVERHKGRMLVRSSRHPAHHGSVFQLFLPWQPG
jgi:PAS domain S-box-containing protein